MMKIRLQKRYHPSQFTFEKLKEAYGIYAVRDREGSPTA